MTALSDLLRRPETAILRVPKIPERAVAVEKAHRNVIKILGAVDARPPPKFELEQVYRRVLQLWTQQHSLGGLSRRDQKALPWILFGYPKDRETSAWLGAQPGFLAELRAQLGPSPRVTIISGLAQAFVRHYPSGVLRFEMFREWLVAVLATSPSIRLRRWQERDALAGLFAPNGPALLIEKWSNSGRSWDAFTKEAGFEGDLGRAELLRRALQENMMRILREETHPAALRKQLEIFKGSDGRLRFDEDRALLAASLLRPFLQTQPPDAIKKPIQQFLSEHLGHPRRNPGRWTGVPMPLQDLFIRWGLAVTFESFFNFIDSTAHVAHWAYRRAFWMAYLRRGMVTDAWIILGNAAHAMAAQHLDKQSLRSGVGRCRDSADPSHSMILMRIGGIVIAEWSHNGKLRAWGPGNRSAPPLYLDEYAASQLRDGDELGLTHHSPATGSWQAKAAMYIGHMTGTYVPDHEYMPRDDGL